MSRPAKQKRANLEVTGFEEERVPFDQVLRKLVATKAAHKVVRKPTPKPPKRLTKR